MKIHDISVLLSPKTVTWEGTERGYSIEFTQKMSEGAVCNLSVITDGVHAGTHMDAPLHFIEGGGTVENLDLTAMIGPAWVVEIDNAGDVTADDLDRAAIPDGTERLLLRTDNTRLGRLHDGVFRRDYAGVSPGAAEWLVDRGVRFLGVDYLSVGPYGDANAVTHNVLLGAGVVVVETLDLSKVQPGKYFLIAVPPKIAGAEASPCRAVLIEGPMGAGE
jgi:arylformamidase